MTNVRYPMWVHILFCIISATLSAYVVNYFIINAGSFLPLFIPYFIPGAIFGVFVLCPLARQDKFLFLRLPAAVILSTATYFGAVSIAETHNTNGWWFYHPYPTVAGAVGSLVIILVAPLILGSRVRVAKVFLAVALGTISGLVMDVGYNRVAAIVWLLGTFLTWQVGVGCQLNPSSVGKKSGT